MRAALLAAFGAPADQGLAVTPIPQLEAELELELELAVAVADDDATERVATSLRAAFTRPPGGDRRGRQFVDAEAAAALGAGGQGRPQRPAVVVPLRRPAHRRSRRAAVGAAVALSTIIGSAGVAAASSSSIPGEELYGVKRAVEDVWVAVAAMDHNAEARVQVSLAQRRLQEVRILRAHGAGRQVMDHALTDADDQIARARQLQPVKRRTIATLQLEREHLTPQAPAGPPQGALPSLTPASGSTAEGPSGPPASPVPAAPSTTPAPTGTTAASTTPAPTGTTAASTTPAPTGTTAASTTSTPTASATSTTPAPTGDSMTHPMTHPMSHLAAAPATPASGTVTGGAAGSAAAPVAAGRPSGSPTAGQVSPLTASPSQHSPASSSSPGPLSCGKETFRFPSALTATPPPTISTPRNSSRSAPALPPAPTVNGQDGAAATALAKRCAVTVAASVLPADLSSRLQALLVARGYDASVARKVTQAVSGAADSAPRGR